MVNKKLLIRLIIVAGILVMVFSGIIIHIQPAKVQVTSKQIKAPHFGFPGLYGEEDYAAAKELKVKYSRPEIAWDSIETSDDVFNFSNIDSKYDQLKSFDLEPMISLRTKQGWGTHCDNQNPELACPDNFSTCPHQHASCPPKDLTNQFTTQGYSQLYYEFVYKTLEHLFNTNQSSDKQRPIEFVIVENEVNTLHFWHGTADDYLKTRATVYQAIRDFNNRYNQDVKVIDNGLAGESLEMAIIGEFYCSGKKNEAVSFAKKSAARKYAKPVTKKTLADMIDCNNPTRSYQIVKKIFETESSINSPTFDYMAYHFYEPWEVQKEVIDWIKFQMDAQGYSRPIINNEGGYADYLGNPDDPSVQKEVANDLIKNQVVAFGEGIEKWLWLPLSEVTDSNIYMGLYSANMTARPAKTSYQLMIEKIGNFSQVEKIEFNHPYVYKFIVEDLQVFVLWDTENSTFDLSSQFSGDVRVTDVSGNSKVISSRLITISPSPIFVESTVVTLSKEVDKFDADPGQILTYSINYTNQGNTLTEVKIEDSVPVGTVYVNDSATNSGQFDGTKIIWNLGEIAPFASGSVSFKVEIK